ncbi:MAG TPA: helix-hairpin-helix domain-containing protein, partial [Tepidisphaeraceae bacterium]|nr:helix-hairpin-helix domain-containing protein [Tepidisphaeraceae bacterium]
TYAATPSSLEMDALSNYRFGYYPTNSMMAGGWPALDVALSSQTKPFNDPSTGDTWNNNTDQRTDYGFITYGDMLQMDLARRLDNPGYNNLSGAASASNAPARFQSLSWADSASLAYHFCLPESTTSPSSTIESMLEPSLLYGVGSSAPASGPPWASPTVIVGPTGGSTYSPEKVYAAAQSTTTQTGYWYNDNFDYDSESMLVSGTVGATSCRPLRALLVARNPVSDNVPWDTNVSWYSGTSKLQSGTTANLPPCRANLNTSNFDELYNAFLAVMFRCDNLAQGPFRTTNATSVGLGTTADAQKLHAALAAINTIAMRGSTYSTLFQTSGTAAQSLSSGTFSNGDVAYVYGMAAQPFITEVVVNDLWESSVSKGAYVAIKLYNPSSQPMDLSTSAQKWQIVGLSGGVLTSRYIFDANATLSGGPVKIPANGYVWITSNTTPPKATSSGTMTVSTVAGVPSTDNPVSDTSATENTLDAAVGKEMLILIRPVSESVAISLTDPKTFAPVDQVDLSQIPAPTPASGDSENRVLIYARAQTAWGCVYPSSSPGTIATSWRTPTAVDYTAPLTDTTTPAYNTAVGTLSSAITWDQTVTASFVSAVQVPLGFDLTSYPNPNPMTAVPYKYPYGAFARDGDAFKIPFIGAYCIVDSTGKFVGINGIAYDSAYADDGDGTDDPTGASTDAGTELIGQFCPVGDPVTGTFDYSTTVGNHRYYFARYLLDYVGATDTPNSDYAPDVDPTTGTPPNVLAVANNPNCHPTQTAAENSSNDYTHIANHDVSTTPKYNNEYDQPNEGLININTAPWPVLAMLPMVTNPTNGASGGDVLLQDNIQLAKEIVAYRDANGPFTSIFDLNKVVWPAGGADGFYNAIHDWTNSGVVRDTMTRGDANSMGEYQRDFTNMSSAASPPFPRMDSANGTPQGFNYNSAKDRLNMLARISNLITTRSDSFTVYIDVEGWKNAGTTSATRVSQTRQAYIIDRSQISGLNKTPTIIPVPTN